MNRLLCYRENRHIHSLQMPNGAEWDAVNGWRSKTSPLAETGNPGALLRRQALTAQYDHQLDQLEAVDAKVAA